MIVIAELARPAALTHETPVEYFMLNLPHSVLPRIGETINVTDTLKMQVTWIEYAVPGYRRERSEANSADIYMQLTPLLDRSVALDEWHEIIRRLHRSPAVTPDNDYCACCGYRAGRMGAREKP